MGQEIIFLMDENIHGVAIRQLINKGIPGITCKEVGLRNTKDDFILQYATENQYIVVTCDYDFLKWDTDWKHRNKAHSGIIYFQMPDQCKNIGKIVREITEIYMLITGGAGTIEDDIFNQVWRVK